MNTWFVCHNGGSTCVIYPEVGHWTNTLLVSAIKEHIYARYVGNNPDFLGHKFTCANGNWGDWDCHSVVVSEESKVRGWMQENSHGFWTQIHSNQWHSGRLRPLAIELASS